MDKDNSDYGIYTAQSGSNKSLNDSTAIDGINFSSYAVRFRTSNEETAGFIFENSNEECLHSLRGSDGMVYFKGNIGIGQTPTVELDISGTVNVNNNSLIINDSKTETSFTNLVENSDFFTSTLTTIDENMILKRSSGYNQYYLTLLGDDTNSTNVFSIMSSESDESNKQVLFTIDKDGQTSIGNNTNILGDIDVNGNISLSGTLEILNNNAFLLPTGTTDERPVVPDTGMIRYNTDKQLFECYVEDVWMAFNQVVDDDQDTFINIDSNNNIEFYAGDSSDEKMSISTSQVIFNQELYINDSTILFDDASSCIYKDDTEFYISTNDTLKLIGSNSDSDVTEMELDNGIITIDATSETNFNTGDLKITSGTLKLTSGNFGIGDITPDYKIDIGADIPNLNNTLRISQNDSGTAIRIGSGTTTSNITLLRVDGSTVNDGSSDDTNQGFSIKYMGQRSGNNNSLSFYSDDQAGESQIEAFMIQQNGDIGIGGNITPSSTLDVNGDVNFRDILTVVGDVSFNSNLTVSQDIYLSGTLISDSDRKIKDNISKITNSLSNIDALNGYRYTRKDLENKEKIHIGVIAQEIETIYPELIEEKNDIKGVNYTGLVGILIECVKELKNENNELKTKYSNLEDKMNKLQTQMINLEKIINK